jgi:hypothetical protein
MELSTISCDLGLHQSQTPRFKKILNFSQIDFRLKPVGLGYKNFQGSKKFFLKFLQGPKF